MADIYVSTAGNDTTGDGSSGNPYATVSKAISVMSASDTIYVKADGTYTEDSTLVPVGGASGAPSRIIGYTTTITDGGQATIQRSSGTTDMMKPTGSYVHIHNLHLDGADLAAVCLYFSGAAYGLAVNVKASRGADYGILLNGDGCRAWRCEVTDMKAGATTAFSSESTRSTFVDCVAHDNPCIGFNLPSNYPTLVRCLAYANTGGSSDGFVHNGSIGGTFIGCIAYSNGRDGIRIVNAEGAWSIVALGNILDSNGGYGLNFVGTAWASNLVDFNVYRNNTSGARNQAPTGANDVTLTADPFEDAANGDFNLNNDVGGGADLRAVTFDLPE